jgi:hypothetical protein
MAIYVAMMLAPPFPPSKQAETVDSLGFFRFSYVRGVTI